jgi:UDP-N-acetylmuramoylalanine--D-glutamate ligase
MFTRLKGEHNFQNTLAAYHACSYMGLSYEAIIEAMRTFEGLAHRQFLVRIINGVPYINDSKATNAEATKMALRSYNNILWIAGGRPKSDGIIPLSAYLAPIQKAYLYGEAATDFHHFISSQGLQSSIFDNLEEALVQAHKDAQDLKGEPNGAPTVLLSPACASFDQYQNFEQRGDHFVQLVQGLTEE